MSMPRPLYFDYAATTPVDEEVAKAMMACLTQDGHFGNPASRSHFYGWQAEQLVETARANVAKLLKADSREIVFTSGATEANNLAIKGVVDGVACDHAKPHIVTSKIEHKAVLDTCSAVEQKGYSVTYISPTSSGEILLSDIESAIDNRTALVSIMHVNNETGVINDIASIGQLCKKRGCLFHVDASQSAGKIDLDVNACNIDLLSLSAHKMYGPKGVGALYVRRSKDVNISAQIHGGGHERGMRSGTLATHQLVGLGEAARIANESLKADGEHYMQLNNSLLDKLSSLSHWKINAQSATRVPNIVNIAFEQVDGEVLLTLLHDIALSTGSACTSASVEPSYVLKAMGISNALAHSSFRISFGRTTTHKDINILVEKIKQAVETLRSSAA